MKRMTVSHTRDTLIQVCKILYMLLYLWNMMMEYPSELNPDHNTVLVVSLGYSLFRWELLDGESNLVT